MRLPRTKGRWPWPTCRASSWGDEATSAKTWRTVLHFDPDAAPLAGAPAIARYVQNEGQGRLIQSIKSHLASASFTRTMIGGRFWTLESLVATYLKQLRGAVPRALPARAVVGRPVRYWGAGDADDDARAVGRMRTALAEAGFTEVVFELEPIAAALRYASGLDHEELILVADFGGGTSDFSVLRVGPRLAPGDAGVILATGGVALGGDSFDARIIDALVAPALGRDTTYRDTFGAMTPVPHWLFLRLRRWHHLSFLKEASTLELLDRIHHGSSDPARIARLVRLGGGRSGASAASGGRALQGGVVGARGSGAPPTAARPRRHGPRAPRSANGSFPSSTTSTPSSATCFRAPGSPPPTWTPCSPREARRWSPLSAGGSAARFGEAKLAGGEELTSVAWGLAARARQLFSAVREKAVAGQPEERASQGLGRQQLSRGVAPALGFAHERGELDEGMVASLDEDAGVEENFVRSGREDREAHVPLREMGTSQLSRQLGGGTAAIGVVRRQRLDQIGTEPEGVGRVARAHQRLGSRRRGLSAVQGPAAEVVAKPRMTGAITRAWHPTQTSVGRAVGSTGRG